MGYHYYVSDEAFSYMLAQYGNYNGGIPFKLYFSADGKLERSQIGAESLFNKWVAICCLYYQYLLHWDVVGFGGDFEIELFAEANTYCEEIAVFWKEFIVVTFASA